MDQFSYISNADVSALDQLHQQYLQNPESVDFGWKKFFEGFDFGYHQKFSNGKGNAVVSEDVLKEINVLNLIDGYRTRGHLFTNTNPVRNRRQYAPTLAIENFGLNQADLEKSFNAGTEVGLGSAKLKDMIIFAYQTAMRFSEILKLQREDVKFDQRIITLRDTKNNEDRTIPISIIAVEILKKYPFGRNFFIVHRDKFRHYFEQACKRADIKGFRFHDLRACSITNLFLSGMAVPEVALISGHKTWSQLRRYTRIKPEQLLDKINNVSYVKSI